MCDCLKIDIPNTTQCLRPGYRVKLGRFQSDVWRVSYGWYTWGGNRPVCGWYLINTEDSRTVKPLQLPDLDDIYLVEY